MGQTLFTLPLRNKRDSMIARQRTRQLAGLLGYDIHEQARIAAGVFAVAWQIVHLGSPVELCFVVEEDRLQVQAQSRRPTPTGRASNPAKSVMCLEKPLPDRGKIAPEDLAWALGKLDQITPAHMYEEVYRVNQELLATMQALQDCQAQLTRLTGEKTNAA